MMSRAGVIDALVNYNNGSTDWLTDTFLMTPQAVAASVVVSNDAGGNPVADIEVSCITATPSDTSLSTAADNLPLQSLPMGPG